MEKEAKSKLGSRSTESALLEISDREIPLRAHDHGHRPLMCCPPKSRHTFLGMTGRHYLRVLSIDSQVETNSDV